MRRWGENLLLKWLQSVVAWRSPPFVLAGALGRQRLYYWAPTQGRSWFYIKYTVDAFCRREMAYSGWSTIGRMKRTCQTQVKEYTFEVCYVVKLSAAISPHWLRLNTSWLHSLNFITALFHRDVFISPSWYMVFIMVILFGTFGWCSYQAWFTVIECAGF